MAKKKPKSSEVWRFQVGQLQPPVVTGMNYSRQRFAFWRMTEQWANHFEDRQTIYLRCWVGLQQDSPSVVIMAEATEEDWRIG